MESTATNRTERILTDLHTRPAKQNAARRGPDPGDFQLMSTNEQRSAETPRFIIEPVRRHSAKAFIALAGLTGEGKTYSALLLALGLAGGDPAKVGLIDTENRRGSWYADIYGKGKPFEHLAFDPPFSPQRYVDALSQMVDKGVEAIVFDSMSHEHEGQGGLEEIAANPRKKLPDWLTAKREHRKFMNAMLQAPAHVIGCFRAREKMDFKDPSKPVSLGIQPICEKNVMFEATVSFMLHDKGRKREAFKLPGCLDHIFGKDGYLTAEMGRELRGWIGGSEGDRTSEQAKNALRLAASKGTKPLQDTFAGLTKPLRDELRAFAGTLKDQAKAADEENAPRDDGSPEDVNPKGPEEKW